MLKIMDSINNHFVRSAEVYTYEITSNSIKGKFKEIYLPGMYLIIKGSYLNDGLYRIASATSTEIRLSEILSPEKTGKSITIYASTPPDDFVELCDDIKHHQETGIGAASESIDDYSVTYNGDGSWQSVYKSKLNQYRRVYSDLGVEIKRRWQDRW